MARFSLLAHGIWEAVLLLFLLVMVILAMSDGRVFTHGGPWAEVAVTGLLASAVVLSLRTGTVNLAAPAIGTLSGILYAVLLSDGWSLVLAAAVTVLVMLLCGLVLGAIVGLSGAPAWAVTLGALGLATAVGLANGLQVRVITDGRISSGWMTVFAVVFVVGSLAGGVLWLVPLVRNGLSASPDSGIGRRLVAALVGLGGSSLIAALAGVLQAGYLTEASFAASGLDLYVVLAAAFLAGASLIGRGGPIAGTVLAVLGLVLLHRLLLIRDAPTWLAVSLPAGLGILLGVLVGRLLDWIGTSGRTEVAG
jgi:ribose/xylose/arabinose/galactoside ABC-type transport system permease subunit